LKPIALALMGAASFCGGVRHKRYSGQQETAPNSDYTQDDKYRDKNINKIIN